MIHKYWMEILGFVVTVATVSLSYFLKLEITIEVVEKIASLCAQILATYVGLILTAYAVLHALKIDNLDKLNANDASTAKSLLAGIHDIFLEAVLILCVGTLGVFFIAAISTIAPGNFIFENSYSDLVNSAGIAFCFGAVVTGTLNIYAAVKVLFELRQ